MVAALQYPLRIHIPPPRRTPREVCHTPPPAPSSLKHGRVLEVLTFFVFLFWFLWADRIEKKVNTSESLLCGA